MNPPFGGSWREARRQAAGEALVRVFAACGCQAEGRPRTDGAGLAVTVDGETTPLAVGPVELTGQGDAHGWPGGISAPAARFFLTARPLAAPVELDVDLAVRRDVGNPCYALIYTHRRLGVLLSRWGDSPAPAELPDGAGRALALTAARYPAAVRQAAARRDPWYVNRCAVNLAEDAWRLLRVRPPAPGDRALLAAAHTALGNALALLGVL